MPRTHALVPGAVPYNGPMRPPAPPILPILSLVAILSGALLLPGCGRIIPGMAGEENIALRTYRDTLLDLDLGYPEGWSFTERRSVSNYTATHDLTFEPRNTLWTRRFHIKVMIPHRLPDDRTLEDFKAEYLARLAAAGDNVRLADTGAAVLGGEPAFRARYATVMNGKPFTRHTDYLCLRRGRDVSLSFEVADDHAGEDIELYRRIAERFRFDST